MKVTRVLLAWALALTLAAASAPGAVLHNDDFEDGVIDSQWTLQLGAEGVISEPGAGWGYLNIKVNGVNNVNWDTASVETAAGYGLPAANWTMECVARLDNPTNQSNTYSELKAYSGNGEFYLYRRLMAYATGDEEFMFKVMVGGSEKYRSSLSDSYMSVHYEDYRLDMAGSIISAYARTVSGSGAWQPVGSYDLTGSGYSAGAEGIKAHLGVNDGWDSTQWFKVGDFTVVPEPATMALLGCGASLVAFRRRRL